ncbi:MAG: putative adenylyltransferase [Methanomassiliicoccales archaeon PtaB.Bin215]|nr:MAG: putative adenylyltransferase [Methanomassiliicoccales archaeon PtaB.Bin215]
MAALIRPGERDEDRHDRTRLIPWVDMERVASAKVLVVGAGALGNEAVKDLVLFGFRHLDVMDMDSVVRSNLSRCVLFREGDQSSGKGKASLVAERAGELDPEVQVKAIEGQVQSLGPEEMKGYDIILGCLDNVAARLHLNANSYHARVPYVDGGTDGFRGRVQTVVPPLTPCLQCGMNRSHFKVMERRFSCTGQDTVFYQPKMAAEITTTSIIAAVQVREAIKILSRRPAIAHVLHYDGLAGTSDILALDIDPECPNHVPGKLS